MESSHVLQHFEPLSDPDEPDAGQQTTAYYYEDPNTGRRFLASAQDGLQGPKFFLQEFRPSGDMYEKDSRGRVSRTWTEPRIEEIEERVGPNGAMAALRAADLDLEAVGFFGGLHHGRRLYHASLADCAECVAQAINRNERYDGVVQFSAEELASREHLDAVQLTEYWSKQAQRLHDAQHHSEGLFRGCHGLLGKPLEQEDRQRILSYLNQPTQEGWLSVRTLMIVGRHTLSQAWVAYDRSAPRSGRVGFPDPDTLRRAIRECVRAREQAIRAKIGEVGSPGLRLVHSRLESPSAELTSHEAKSTGIDESEP